MLSDLPLQARVIQILAVTHQVTTSFSPALAIRPAQEHYVPWIASRIFSSASSRVVPCVPARQARTFGHPSHPRRDTQSPVSRALASITRIKHTIKQAAPQGQSDNPFVQFLGAVNGGPVGIKKQTMSFEPILLAPQGRTRDLSVPPGVADGSLKSACCCSMRWRPWSCRVS
jgi:hypothetical protein